jgi:RNA polymerase sigma factor (sigma-70 family)
MQQQEERRQQHNSDSTLYDRYGPAIFAYARLHMASWDDAEDLTIEVFLTAFEHDNLSWLRGKQQLVWLRRVAHNKLVDRFRRAPHAPVVPLEEIGEEVIQDDTLAPEQVALQREELERLYRAVGKLPVPQRQVLGLRYGDGLRFAEIAALLDKSEAAVRKLCSRALAGLRHDYERQEQ